MKRACIALGTYILECYLVLNWHLAFGMAGRFIPLSEQTFLCTSLRKALEAVLAPLGAVGGNEWVLCPPYSMLYASFLENVIMVMHASVSGDMI